MTITALPAAPSTADPANFNAKADAFIAALGTFVTEANAVAVAMNLNSTTDTSVTSVLIGTGAKTFTVTAGKSFQPGMFLVIADTAAPSTNSMYGQITSYSGTTLVVNVLSVLGSGTKTAWTISQTSAANMNVNTAVAVTGSAVVSGAVQSGTNPKFSAYLSATQNIASGVSTKVSFNTTEFNVGAMFDATTNRRFTPTVAGYYQFTGTIACVADVSTLTQAYSSLVRNGITFKTGAYYYGPGISYFWSPVSALIYLNGTTDYVEMYGYIVGTNPLWFGNPPNTFLSGTLIP